MDLRTPLTLRRRLAFALVFALVVAACASGAASPAGNGAMGGASAPAAAAPSAGGNNAGPDNGGNNGNAAPEGNGNGTPDGTGGETGSGETAAFQDLVRLVYDGTMRLRVEDLEAAVRAGRDAVLAAGGYIAASRHSTEETSETASVTYRIPADRWEETIELLRGLGDQIGEEINSTEVTAQIVDLEARLRNLRVHEAGVQRLAAEATTFEDILDGQERLARVRQEIEQLDAQLASLENRADLGTLTVTFGTEAQAVTRAAEVVAAGWDGQGEVARATATLVGMLQSLASIGIWLGIVLLPLFALLLALALVARLVVRRTRLLDRLATQPIDPRLPGA
jgi:hypothetical protein